MSKHPLQRLLVLLLLPPALLATCASVFQGPLFGSITLQRPSDAGDAVAFLRCRGQDCMALYKQTQNIVA